jgi:hypothetical protein
VRCFWGLKKVGHYAVGALLLSLQGCLPNPVSSMLTGSSTGTITLDQIESDPSLNLSQREILERFSKAVCDPLRSPEEWPDPVLSSEYKYGLVGAVTAPVETRTAPLTEWNDLDRFLEEDNIVFPNPIFMLNINVPTRPFTSGFPTMGGDFVTQVEGQVMTEYFRLDMYSYLELPSNRAEARYEFALLSDDGARVAIDGRTIIDHPAFTGSKLMCGTEGVDLYHASPRTFEMSYSQGPRFHIAVQLFWRVARTTPEPLCGTVGNTTWYDFTDPENPIPKQTILDMRARGWSVVPFQAFKLPIGEDLNPCLSENVKKTIEENEEEETP